MWKKIGAVLVVTAVLSGCQTSSDIQVPQGCRLSDVVDQIPDRPPVEPGSSVRLDPETLQTMLLESGLSVKLGTMRVHEAKAQVNLARAQLFPSLNLGVLLHSSNGSGFGLSLVEAALPFLVPSNWFNYHASQELLEAEKAGLWTLKLNEYASAYSLLVSLATDQELLASSEASMNDSERIEARVETLHRFGLASASDVHRARAVSAGDRGRMERVRELVLRERAILKSAIAVSPETELSVSLPELAQTPAEGQPLSWAVSEAKKHSPESVQMAYLRRAAQLATWSKKFGFIGGTTIRSPGMDGMPTDVSFGNINVNEGLNLGYAIFPTVELSQLQERELALQQENLDRGIAETVEIIYHAQEGANARLDAASEAERSLSANYESTLRKYGNGLTDLGTLLGALAAKREAGVHALATRSQLALARIGMHRLLLSERFGTIQGCER